MTGGSRAMIRRFSSVHIGGFRSIVRSMYKHELNDYSSIKRRPRGWANKAGSGGLRSLLKIPAAILFGAAAALLIMPAGRRDERVLPRISTEKEAPNSVLLDLVPRETAPTDEPESPGTVRLDSSTLTVSIDGEAVEMELEDYLVGVVAGEMPASSEPDALAAQAIAARTFTALHMSGKAKCKSGCTVCSDAKCCQAYFKPETCRERWGDSYEKNLARVKKAVSDTAGLVAVYNGNLITAVYHASSGPATESSEAVFAMALPYLVSVESFEGDHGVVSVQEFTEAELVKKLSALFPEAKLTVPLSPGDLEVWGRNESGRVQLIRIGETVVTGPQLRMALGLKSAAFTVERSHGKVRFTCTGYGHGVGMSQTGANEMAKAGYTFEEIIKHYYTGTELARLKFGE